MIKIAYTTTKQVLDLIGLSNNINHENVGTGNGTALSFDLDHENVITGSYTLYYGVSGSNSFTDLTETTHYTLDKNKGKILLTSAGASVLSTKVLYAKYVWCEPFTDDEVSAQITFVDTEVDLMTDRKWDTATSFTEELDYQEIIDDRDYAIYETTEDRATEKPGRDFIIVKFKPLASVTKVEFFDKNGDEITDAELSSSNYPDEWQWWDYGKILFKNYGPATGYKQIKVTGTYGQATTPNQITELSGWLTGLRLYMNLSGGSYNDVTSYSLGGTSISVGEPYINIREFMTQANRRIEQLRVWIGDRIIIMGV